METGFSSFPKEDFDEFVRKLQSETASLPRQEAKLAQYMQLNLRSLGLETGKTLAAKVGVSEVTVGRMLRRLGCDGMKGLKAMLRQHYALTSMSFEQQAVPSAQLDTLDAETRALRSVFAQTEGRVWDTAIRTLASASAVHVTGFQSVRGLAEDFSRRMALARDDVHYLSPHDGMLAEWLSTDRTRARTCCLVLIDVVPYAHEAQKMAQLARSQGRSCIVVTDEFCHWAGDLSQAAFHAPSRTGLFLESTVGLVMLLSLLVDGVARQDQRRSARRLVAWKRNARKLDLF